MKINKIVGLNPHLKAKNVNFERRLREDEKYDYTNTINQAMNYLGIVNRAFIIHSSSFPTETNKIDTGAGTHIGNDKFIDFIKMNGFNAIQLGPMGKYNYGSYVPYSSSILAKNPLVINYDLLTQPQYASILSKQDIEDNSTDTSIDGANYAMSDFDFAQNTSEILLAKAHKNFEKKLSNNDIETKKLNQEYENFKNKNDYWMDYYSVIDCLTKEYKTDIVDKWNEKDRNIIKNVREGNNEARKYLTELHGKYKSEIELYKFAQFITEKQLTENQDKRKDITFIGDLLVGASATDELFFSDAFHKKYKLGCQKGGAFNGPQTWGLPVLDPNKLFDDESSNGLGVAGEYLKRKLEIALSDTKNIRIDHAMGLIDPYIYDKDSLEYIQKTDEDGNMVRCPDLNKLKSGYLSDTDLDKNQNYQRILKDIVIPTLIEHGVNPMDVVWEDIGSENGTFSKIFRQEAKKLGVANAQNNEKLPGVTALKTRRGQDAQKNNWTYVGCHDDAPLQEMIRKNKYNGHYAWNPDYLAGYLNPMCNNQADWYKWKITHDPKEMAKAKFTDLMRSTDKIQVFFADFFGIDKRYNNPGGSKENWLLRVNPDYEDTYYKSLENNDYAMNMPEILHKAIHAKIDLTVAESNKSDEDKKIYQAEMQSKAKGILDGLWHYANVLKEKEEKSNTCQSYQA